MELDRLIAIHVYGNMCPQLPFSTELDYAFGVVHRMREKGFRMELRQLKTDVWSCSMKKDEGRKKTREAETPQLAICLAALKTLGVKYE